MILENVSKLLKVSSIPNTTGAPFKLILFYHCNCFVNTEAYTVENLFVLPDFSVSWYRLSQ